MNLILSIALVLAPIAMRASGAATTAAAATGAATTAAAQQVAQQHAQGMRRALTPQQVIAAKTEELRTWIRAREGQYAAQNPANKWDFANKMGNELAILLGEQLRQVSKQFHGVSQVGLLKSICQSDLANGLAKVNLLLLEPTHPKSNTALTVALTNQQALPVTAIVKAIKSYTPSPYSDSDDD